MTEVLIVGAGPTGLLLAAELARAGVGARIVDKAPRPVGESRAFGVVARTLEIFDDLGIAEEAIRRGRRLDSMNLYDGGPLTGPLRHERVGLALSLHPRPAAVRDGRPPWTTRGGLRGPGRASPGADGIGAGSGRGLAATLSRPDGRDREVPGQVGGGLRRVAQRGAARGWLLPRGSRLEEPVRVA